MATERLMYRIPEFAEAIGASRAKGYEMVASGAVPSVVIGGLRRVPVSVVHDIIAKQLRDQVAAEPVAP